MPKSFPFPSLSVATAPLLALTLSGCSMVSGANTMMAASLRVWPDKVVMLPGQTQTVMVDLTARADISPGPYALSVDPLPGVLDLRMEPQSLDSQGRAYLTLSAADQAQSGHHVLLVTVKDPQGKALHGSVEVFIGQDRPVPMPYFPQF